MKQKLQQLDNQINQAKHLKKQKVGELKGSVQSGMQTLRFGTSNINILKFPLTIYVLFVEALSLLLSYPNSCN